MTVGSIIFMRGNTNVTDTPFVDDAGSWYSAGWPKGATDEQLAALGITKLVEAAPPPEGPPSLTAQADVLAALIDAEVDGIYQRVIGNRQPEYTEAERQAQAYRDAGYAGAVPAYVASWVTASGKTATAAADDILAQAGAWRAAAGAMRAARLGHKAQAKAAATQAALDAVRASWASTIGQIKTALGLGG